MPDDKYFLSLNHEGVDYQVEVPDIDTANLLLNDVVAAGEYVNRILKSSSQTQSNESLEVLVGQQPITESQPQSEYQDESQLSTQDLSYTKDTIWTKKKPTERDNEATALMLKLREERSSLFDDKKTRKVKLWNDIAKDLKGKDFHLGEKGGERCRQKFANLQKAYLAYIKHQTTTGTERNDDFPPFFEELHSILGGKHKVNPIILEDSMDTDDKTENTLESTQNEIEYSNDENEESFNQTASEDISSKSVSTPSTSKSILETPGSRFRKANRKLTPSRQDQIVKEIQKDRNIRSDEFSFLKRHLLKSEQQKDRFLDILEVAFGVRKRKREDSSDSD